MRRVVVYYMLLTSGAWHFYYFPHTNISLIKLVSSFAYTAEKMPADANLRGVAHEIVHQAKLDAFVTLMEVKQRNSK